MMKTGNIRDKVGQRVMLAFEGTELTPQMADWFLICRPGGLILFGRNITSLDQVTALNRDFQGLAAKHGLPPLIIALDEEGGRVSRRPVEGQAWIAPSQMAQAAAGIEAVRACAAVTARRLRHTGFNLNFAPVADVNNNPVNPVIGSRSFGSDPQKVAEAVVAAVQAYNENGMGSCAKHFPGHGDTEVDSHKGLPVVRFGRERLDEIELLPFRRAIEAGVPTIMTAHILYPLLEPDLPATLSRRFLVDLLRNELGFKGLVVTDSLEMKAISDYYSPYESSLATLKAGADIALPCNTMEAQRIAFEGLVEAAERGEFELDKPLERIQAFKEKFCAELPPENVSLELLDEEAADADAILEAARGSITLYSSRPGFDFSARWQRPAVIDFTLPIASLVEEGRQPGPLLRQDLGQAWSNLRYLKLPSTPSDSDTALALELARSADLLVVLVRNGRRIPTLARTLQTLLSAHSNVVFVAARDPFDLTLAEGAAASLACYGDPPCSIVALVEVLTGKRAPTGQLPVTLR